MKPNVKEQQVRKPKSILLNIIKQICPDCDYGLDDRDK